MSYGDVKGMLYY